jgi:lipopolysaccharide/colanic/teichoic acid biosynthesis glycosyltransferase
MISKRLFDIFFSIVGLIILLPLFLIIALVIVIESRGGVFYLQNRVGKNGIDFKLYKFRTMFINSDKAGLITVGMRDSRITRVGYQLRKYKFDELPQLLNVLQGSMSFVGPRPEVRKYVELYNDDQLNVLKVKPGITDYASIEYSNENELLGNASDPDQLYVEVIMPAKLSLNLKYINEISIATDVKLILQTIKKIVS